MKLLTALTIPLTALFALSVATNCSAPVPFSSSLIGKKFSNPGECYRPGVLSEVKIFATVFVYVPTYITRFSVQTCIEKYVFHFRRDGKDPFIVRFPPLEITEDISVTQPNGVKSLSGEEFVGYCRANQLKLKENYFPVGPTRGQFITAVREIVKGSVEIRDFGCEETPEGGFQRIAGRAFQNVDLDGIITYLLGVGYQYKFCAEAP